MQFRRLQIESLESRRTLAGNINVTLTGGSLILTGDAAGNGLSIHQVDYGRYVVIGFPLDNVHTTINGSTAPKVFQGVTNDIRIDLAAGDDIAVISNTYSIRQKFAKEFSEGSSGNLKRGPEVPKDYIAPLQTQIPRNLIIDMGSGNDGVGVTARAGNQGFGGLISIEGGTGADKFAVEQSFANDDILLNAGRGDDNARIVNTTARDFIFAQLDSGRDLFTGIAFAADRATIDTGDDSDAGLRISNSRTNRTTTLLTGTGNDSVSLGDHRARDLFIDGGRDFDAISVRDTIVHGTAQITSFNSTDRVVIDGLMARESLYVLLGAGNDFLSIRNSSSNRAILRGDMGFDTFSGSDNVFKAEFIQQFERQL